MNLFGITFSASDMWLLGAAGVLIIVLMQQWLADSKADSRAKLARILSAGDKFQAYSSDTLAMLRNNTDSPFTILERQFSDHESAVLEFAEHLHNIKRVSFLKAWREYYCHDQANIRFLEQYTTTGVSLSQAKSNRKLAIQRIEHLLTYAKQT